MVCETFWYSLTYIHCKKIKRFSKLELSVVDSPVPRCRARNLYSWVPPVGLFTDLGFLRGTKFHNYKQNLRLELSEVGIF